LWANGFGWNFPPPAIAPPQKLFGVWASIGINAVASGSVHAARLRLTPHALPIRAQSMAAALPLTSNPLENCHEYHRHFSRL
jgi:hypothetical protein